LGHSVVGTVKLYKVSRIVISKKKKNIAKYVRSVFAMRCG